MTQSGANSSLAILAILAGKRGVVRTIIERCSKLPCGSDHEQVCQGESKPLPGNLLRQQLTEAVEDGNGKADHTLVVVFKGANRTPREHLINVVMVPLRQSN